MGLFHACRHFISDAPCEPQRRVRADVAPDLLILRHKRRDAGALAWYLEMDLGSLLLNRSEL